MVEDMCVVSWGKVECTCWKKFKTIHGCSKAYGHRGDHTCLCGETMANLSVRQKRKLRQDAIH